MWPALVTSTKTPRTLLPPRIFFRTWPAATTARSIKHSVTAAPAVDPPVTWCVSRLVVEVSRGERRCMLSSVSRARCRTSAVSLQRCGGGGGCWSPAPAPSNHLGGRATGLLAAATSHTRLRTRVRCLTTGTPPRRPIARADGRETWYQTVGRRALNRHRTRVRLSGGRPVLRTTTVCAFCATPPRPPSRTRLCQLLCFVLDVKPEGCVHCALKINNFTVAHRTFSYLFNSYIGFRFIFKCLDYFLLFSIKLLINLYQFLLNLQI